MFRLYRDEGGSVHSKLAVRYLNRSLPNSIPCALDKVAETAEQSRFLPWEFQTRGKLTDLWWSRMDNCLFIVLLTAFTTTQNLLQVLFRVVCLVI